MEFISKLFTNPFRKKIRIFRCPNQSYERFEVFGCPPTPPVRISQGFSPCGYLITEEMRDCAIITTCPRCGKSDFKDFVQE